ncbi:MAG: hypothetical protein ACLU4N_24190 [Butyricimonas faecihominis]
MNIIAIKMGLSEEAIAKSDISKNKHIYGDVFEAFMGLILPRSRIRQNKKRLSRITSSHYELEDLGTLTKLQEPPD